MRDRTGERWTCEEEEQLYGETVKGLSAEEIAVVHFRNSGGIRARQKRLGLRDDFGHLISPFPEFRSSSPDDGAYEKARRKQETSRNGRSRRPGQIANSGHSKAPETGQGGIRNGNQQSRLQTTTPIWPDGVPLGENCVETLWNAIRFDLDSMHPALPGTPLSRDADIGLSRLSPGDDYYPGKTLAELGERYGVSRERIRQIENKLLRRLRARTTRSINLTALALTKVADSIPEDYSGPASSWFALELANHHCNVPFAEFTLSAFVAKVEGISGKSANKMVAEAVRQIKKMARHVQSPRRQGAYQTEEPEPVRRANEFVLNILRRASWPSRLHSTSVDLTGFIPLRECSVDRGYFAQSLKRLVGFDSWAEHRVIRALDTCSIVTEFAEQPIRIEYEFDGQRSVYIPDLLLKTKEELPFVIEVKSRLQLADYRTLAKAAAAQVWLAPKGIGYCLVDKTGFGLDDLREVELREDFLGVLRMLNDTNGLVTRTSFERACDGRMSRHEAYDQLQSVVLRHGMRYDTQLSRPPGTNGRYLFDFRLSGGDF